jgi:copper chaperone CopZ
VLTKKLRVDDMQCQGCAGRVRAVLLNTPGVVKVITSLDDHTAEVTFDGKSATNESLLDALRAAGFLSNNPNCC